VQIYNFNVNIHNSILLVWLKYIFIIK